MKKIAENKMLQISLASARVNAKMTQEEVSKALRVSKTTIVNWENNRTVPDVRMFRELCALYNIPEEYIFLIDKYTISV